MTWWKELHDIFPLDIPERRLQNLRIYSQLCSLPRNSISPRHCNIIPNFATLNRINWCLDEVSPVISMIRKWILTKSCGIWSQASSSWQDRDDSQWHLRDLRSKVTLSSQRVSWYDTLLKIFMYWNCSRLCASIVLHLVCYLLGPWYMGTFDTVDNPQLYAWAMYASRSVPSNHISEDWFRYNKEVWKIHGMLVFFLCLSSICLEMIFVGMEETSVYAWWKFRDKKEYTIYLGLRGGLTNTRMNLKFNSTRRFDDRWAPIFQCRRAAFISTSSRKEGILSNITVRHNGGICKGSRFNI